MKKKILSVIISFILIMLFACDTDEDRYLVTASLSQDAVDAGMKILDEGGSAMDAALSVALSEIAVTGGKYISYAGMLNVIYFEAETGKIHNMNAAFNTIQNEEDPLTIPRANYGTDTTRKIVDGRTILIPGFMKGVEEAHNKFGKIPFKNLFDNAIMIAEKGTVWTKFDDNAFWSGNYIFDKYPESKALFTKPDGSYYNIGDIFTQPELAKTLKKISIEGSDYMYRGKWAQKFVSAARNIGSKITLQDMKNYEVIWSDPVHGNYHGFDIYTHGIPAFGGVTLIEALNLAEISKLSEKEHYAKSTEALATLFQVLKASFYSSVEPKHFKDKIDLTTESRLKKATSKLIWEQMLTNDETKNTRTNIFRNEHSAAIVAVDRGGNMVAMIHSINTLNWGSNGLFVDGISIPDPATFQQKMIHKVGPGKRLPDPTNPGIVIKDGQPILGFSCIGRGLHNQTLTSLINILDFKMTPNESVETPTVGSISPYQGTLALLIEPNKFSADLIDKAKDLGIILLENSIVISGYWTGIYREAVTGKLRGTEVWLK
ncbi:MAG: gamma-glutamyltransferase [Candidatus Delongbacteria bacterium]|jgi:gamma-glutamyltranspeptidase/glutathione hydrolase|nr:gamma-glutamyltransferase [Candidatus Delongbacteria bacterium]